MKIQKKIDLNAQSKMGRYSALAKAVGYGQIEIVKLLIKEKARIDIQSGTGETALAMAVDEYFNALNLEKKNRYFEIIKFLINEGADATLKDSNNESVFDLIRRNMHVGGGTILRLIVDV